MEDHYFSKGSLTGTDPSRGWTESQYNQLKNQILAYKYLSRNMSIPPEIVENIRGYESGEWDQIRERTMNTVQENYEKKFENHDLSMKELAVYFKKRMKEQEAIPRLWPDRNYGEEIEYNVDQEIENRKIKLVGYLNHIDPSSCNEEVIGNVKNELKLLKVYNLQKKVRKEVMMNFVTDFEKQNSVYYTDMLFQKTLLDRRFYKRTSPFGASRKDQKLNDRFEQQLRNGYDIRKKDKHREFLNKLMLHQRDYMEFHKTRKQNLKKRAAQAKNFLENREKKDQQEKEKKERERLILLRKNDIEGYRKFIEETKDVRLMEFMRQTDLFLKEIEDKILTQKQVVQTLMKNQEEILAKEEGENLEEEDPDKAQDKPHVMNTYYHTAHAAIEEVKFQPTLLEHGTLKSYQMIGLQWLVSLYVNNLNGILADEMGLGKTIQTIALICYLIEKKMNSGPYLIVVPLATITNWMLEFAKWAPKVKLIIYKGPPNHRRGLAYQLKNEKDKYNVVLTTYEYIMKDKFSLNKIIWQYIIVDEGHRMKNFKSKFTQTLGTQFNSVYRLLLTGTPLQNNLTELWALLNFLLPKIFNSSDEFEKWFNQPFASRGPSGDKNMELNEEEHMLIINRLHTVLRPFLLRREKKDVEKELPNKTEYVIKVELSAWQKIMYDQIKEKGILARDPSNGKNGKKALMNTMMQLRKICNHPYLFLDYNNPLYERIDDMIYRSSGK